MQKEGEYQTDQGFQIHVWCAPHNLHPHTESSLFFLITGAIYWLWSGSPQIGKYKSGGRDSSEEVPSTKQWWWWYFKKSPVSATNMKKLRNSATPYSKKPHKSKHVKIKISVLWALGLRSGAWNFLPVFYELLSYSNHAENEALILSLYPGPLSEQASKRPWLAMALEAPTTSSCPLLFCFVLASLLLIF